jgi:peptidoglycan hydrolase-like protein with peptidoglycan-binding domain
MAVSLAEFKGAFKAKASPAAEPKYATGLEIPQEPKYATGLEIPQEPKYATGLDIREEPGADATDVSKEGMPAPFDISASVGKGGKNLEDDVRAVQVALNRRIKAGLSVDGKSGPKLITAIYNFQKALGQSRPDGRVDPGRGTARALAESGKLGPPPKPPQPLPPPDLGVPKLDTAPVVWNGTRHILSHNIKELKRSISQEYANEHPQLIKAIDENVKKVDVILERLDDRLAKVLERANAAKNDDERATELASASEILRDYIRYVKDETLIGYVDKNPFGVDTKVGKVITDSLKHMAKSIG